MPVFAAIGPHWAHGFVLLVLAALLSAAGVWALRDVSLSPERRVTAVAAVLLSLACLILAVYTFLT
jgi:hypothetical protein